MKKIIILLLVFLTVLVCAVFFDMKESTQTEFLLNTVSSITVKGGDKESAEKAFDRVREVEQHMSSHIKSSDLFTGNLNKDTLYVINKGIEFGKISNGIFDISIKPICDLWSINSDNPKVPKKEETEKILPLVDYKKITVKKNKLILPEGMGIELGAIAKGYAADEACRVLRENGVKDGIVDLGGNIVALGTKTVGVRNPVSENNGDYFGTLKITDSAVATSGGYERYFEQDGTRYHHIFDPSTGCPVETDVLSATVVCERAIEADCWSTILFSAGTERAKHFAEAYSLNAVLMDKNENVYLFGDLDFTPKKDINIIKKQPQGF